MKASHPTCSINPLCIHTMLAALYAWCIQSLRSTTEVSQARSILVLCFISQSIWQMLGCHGWQSDSPLCCIRHKWNQATLFRSNTWISPYLKMSLLCNVLPEEVWRDKQAHPKTELIASLAGWVLLSVVIKQRSNVQAKRSPMVHSFLLAGGCLTIPSRVIW